MEMEMNPLTLFFTSQYILFVVWIVRSDSAAKERIKALEKNQESIEEKLLNREKREEAIEHKIDKLFSIITDIKVSLERKQNN